MARDGEHFFMCFSAIWISSFDKVLIRLYYIGWRLNTMLIRSSDNYDRSLYLNFKGYAPDISLLKGLML
jgi:hypothetical protein